MQRSNNQIRIRKPVFVFIIIVITLAFATPVLADYLGPDRVTTESHVVTFDYGVWAEAGEKCFDRNGNPSDCIICHWEHNPGGACGSATYSYKLGSRSEVVTKTVILPPATIDGTLQNCTLQNGWCVTPPELFIDSKEPLPGEKIITIEGTLNGATFACIDPSCSIPLMEGDNSFTYWAISSWGDSSTKGIFDQKVDTVSPNVSLDVNGSNGTNGWYVSPTTVTATGSDSTSGLYETLLSVDNGVWQPSATLNDGVYSIAVRATDNANNISNSSTIISVDTTTPTLNLDLKGTRGNNNWYISKVNISATANDVTSGVASLEFRTDGGAYQKYVSVVQLSDGQHTYQFRVTDKAGNITESPLQKVLVDTTFPAISLTEELSLGDIFYYDVQDDGSNLATIRVVIEDEDERFPKVSWQEPYSGNKFKDEILWDGKFKDGTQAPAGTYYVTIKATDAAGNESIKAGAVKVELFSFLQVIPTFTVPTSSADSEVFPSIDQNSVTSPPDSAFGGTITESTGTNSQSVLLSAGTSSSTSTPTSSNVLWGAIAVAVIGTATTYALDEKRKRKEAEAEELRQAEAKAEQLNAAEAERKAQEWQDGQNILNSVIKDALAQGASDKEIADLKTQAATEGLGVAIDSGNNLTQSLVDHKAASQQALEDFHAQEMEFAINQAEQQAAAELQAGLMAYYEGRKAGEVVETVTEAPTQEPTWLENAWNWVFKNQVELSLGTGIAVGLAAVAGVVLGIITAPVWIVIGAAVLITAAIVTAGTLAINNHFDLDWGNSLLTNLVVGTTATAITTGVGLLLTSLAPAIGTTIKAVCTQYATACSQVGTVVDSGEEAILSLQLAYYNWIGDQDNAAQTEIELQLELMDGGVPGNAIASELGEQLAKLGPDALEQVAKYGDDVIPLLIKYGDDAVDIIGAYGDEGVALLLKYGDNTLNVIRLVKRYGTSAVKLLDIVDISSAGKLLKTLDDDVLDYAMSQGPDALAALSRWSDDELLKFGPELALRAKNDAKVLDALTKLVDLGPIDPKHLTSQQQELINIIAENSIHYSDNGQLVLGKWVDYANGFTSYARETGSVHYNPHPDMWNILGGLGDAREETAWLVNEKVIQTGIDKGLPFEYSLDGIPTDKLEFEEYAIDTIWEGGSSKEVIYTNIKESLGVDTVPIRLKELVELYSAGYTFSFDNITNSYILIKP